MGYEIHYGPAGEMRRIAKYKVHLKKTLALIAFVAVLLLLYHAFDEEIHLAVNALEGMAGKVQEGSGIKEAFSEFCLEVLEGANIE